MKYIRLESTDPYYNLAVEEYLLRNGQEDIFMLWQNRPVVVIGKNQNAYAEVDLSYARAHGIDVCRRITGGGAVYHDLGNLNYTFITSTKKAQALDYAYFTGPIIQALCEMGIPCTLSGRNDLEADGKKFSGNAQSVSDERILHHGTLLFDTDAEVLSSVLKVDKEKLEFKAVKSHKSRVVNLCTLFHTPILMEEFIARIEAHVIRHLHAEKIEFESNAEVEALAARNRSIEWIYSDKRYLTSYTVYRKRKYPFGVVKLAIRQNKDIIEEIVISGDFFGKAPIEELEEALKGKSIHALPTVDVARYIDQMTPAELSALITEDTSTD